MVFTTLHGYLTEANPVVDQTHSLPGLPTKVKPEADIKITEWKDFTYSTLISCYGDVLRTELETPLPDISPPLSTLEREIYDEDSLDHLLTRSIVPVVSESLRRAWEVCYPDHSHLAIDITRGGRARGSARNPAATSAKGKSKVVEQDEGKAFPDWAGVQKNLDSRSYVNRCPGDTKLSTKWYSKKDVGKESYYWPLAQLIKYCGGNWNTKYGYVISQAELVVLRISRAMIPSGIALKRSPRNTVVRPVPTTEPVSPIFVPSSPPDIQDIGQQSHKRGVSITSTLSEMSIDAASGRSREASVTTSTRSLSTSEPSQQVTSSQSYVENETGGEYRPIEMMSIPWKNSGPGMLTVKLALWWLHMMAAAPGCDIKIGPEYPALDSWVLRDGIYYHSTTGIAVAKLPDGANLISTRQTIGDPVTPPHRDSASNLPPSSPLSSPPPPREDMRSINWLQREGQWQYQTVHGSPGRMRVETPVWSREREDYYYARLEQGRVVWVPVESDHTGSRDKSGDESGGQTDDSMGLP